MVIQNTNQGTRPEQIEPWTATKSRKASPYTPIMLYRYLVHILFFFFSLVQQGARDLQRKGGQYRKFWARRFALLSNHFLYGVSWGSELARSGGMGGWMKHFTAIRTQAFGVLLT